MSRLLHIPFSALLLIATALNASAHGGAEHAQITVADDADWATKHMAEEHHITAFDGRTFFSLHDYDGTGLWTDKDIRRTYGLEDASTSHISELKKRGVVSTILEMFDMDKSGTITVDEFVAKWDSAEQVRLPDFGMGPGHHGDDEYEYEIHHWEKYHSGDDVKEEDLNHPEDIEHFRKHDEMEAAREEWERREGDARKGGGVVLGNIPVKFRIN